MSEGVQKDDPQVHKPKEAESLQGGKQLAHNSLPA